jgi:hypothetical protein
MGVLTYKGNTSQQAALIVTVQLGMKKCQLLAKNARLPTNTALIYANSGIKTLRQATF